MLSFIISPSADAIGGGLIGGSVSNEFADLHQNVCLPMTSQSDSNTTSRHITGNNIFFGICFDSSDKTSVHAYDVTLNRDLPDINASSHAFVIPHVTTGAMSIGLTTVIVSAISKTCSPFHMPIILRYLPFDRGRHVFELPFQAPHATPLRLSDARTLPAIMARLPAVST